MTGFGSPCGACKCLRRKCTRGCIFAPYFCQEESVTHFAAIHKVFGASNFSKLLTNLPVSDRCEAAVSISYEALARVQDPIYGCVSHIFALQQQVANLEAQVAVLKAQTAQNTFSESSTQPCSDEEKPHRTFPSYSSSSAPNYFSSGQLTTQQQFCQVNEHMDPGNLFDDHHIIMPGESYCFSSLLTPSNGIHTNTRTWDLQNAEDLQSVAFPYLQNS